MFRHNQRKMIEWYCKHINDDDHLFDLEYTELSVMTIIKTHKYRIPTSKEKKKFINKKNSKEVLDLFIKRNVTNIGKFKEQENRYCVVDEKNVYIVFPTMKNETIVADHISIMKDNVHLTTYLPLPINTKFGRTIHIPKCPITKDMEFPLSGYDTKHFRCLASYSNEILDTIRRPYLQSAGSSQKLSLHKHKTRKQNTSISQKLQKHLNRLRIDYVSIFCIRQNESFHTSVFTNVEDCDMSFTFIKRPHTSLWKQIENEIVSIYNEK
jgi:hypothetical protein